MQNEGADKVEYRVWNPFRSKLAAAILGGVDQIHMPPGSKVLYLGAASGTTVSHVSDVVGPVGKLYISILFLTFARIVSFLFCKICFCIYRRDLYMLLSSLTDQEEI